MQPKNFAARRKRIVTFAGLYAASVILMLFIFSAFGGHISMHDENTLTARPGETTMAGNRLLQADSLLHGRLRLWQQTDNEYFLLADTAAAWQQDNARRTTEVNESAFKNATDSIAQLAAAYTGNEALLYKTMLHSFESIAADRQALRKIHSSIKAGTPVPAGTQIDLLQWQDERTQKGNAYARLQAEIKSLREQGAGTSNAAGNNAANQHKTDSLESAYHDQQAAYNDLKEKYARLKTSDNNLAAQVLEYRKAANTRAENDHRSAADKLNLLQQNIEDLNAAIRFAKIDCNLARADAQQIISNARQRKELLSESLSLLNQLVKSGDATTRQKATERIRTLQHISATLRD